MTVILEPQDAAAAGICWLARWHRLGRLHGAEAVSSAASGRHPEKCGWCRHAPTELLVALEEFNRQDGEESRLSGRFRALPRDAQRALVDRSLYGTAVLVP